MIDLQIRSKVILALMPAGLLLLACAPRSTADMILTGGVVITLDKYNPPAQALAIVDGRILAVGRDDEIQRLAGLTTKRINLRGAVVLPGLTDSHFHLSSLAEQFGHRPITRSCHSLRAGEETSSLGHIQDRFGSH